MDHTALDFRLWIDRTNGFFKAWKAIYAEKQHILYSAILQVIEHSQPELRGFICSNRNAEDVFVYCIIKLPKVADQNGENCISKLEKIAEAFG